MLKQFGVCVLCLRFLGVPWTEDEHRLFLIGLQKLGKGDWRGIARNFVVSRSPTQVASHAQKFFIRQSNATRRKRRSSLFDMVPEMVCLASLMVILHFYNQINYIVMLEVNDEMHFLVWYDSDAAEFLIKIYFCSRPPLYLQPVERNLCCLACAL